MSSFPFPPPPTIMMIRLRHRWHSRRLIIRKKCISTHDRAPKVLTLSIELSYLSINRMSLPWGNWSIKILNSWLGHSGPIVQARSWHYQALLCFLQRCCESPPSGVNGHGRRPPTRKAETKHMRRKVETPKTSYEMDRVFQQWVKSDSLLKKIKQQQKHFHDKISIIEKNGQQKEF